MKQFKIVASPHQRLKALVNCRIAASNGEGEVTVMLDGENDLNLSPNGLVAVEDGTSSYVYYLRTEHNIPIRVTDEWLMAWASVQDGNLIVPLSKHRRLTIRCCFSEAYLAALDLTYEDLPGLQENYAKSLIDRLNSMAELRVLDPDDSKITNCLALLNDWLRLKRAVSERIHYK